MTAERRSTAAARFSMLMPLERKTRPASKAGGGRATGGAGLLDAEAAGAQNAAGLDGGEAFVPEFDGQVGALFERSGELADPDRLPPFRAAHINGVAEQDHADFALADQLFQHVEVAADPGADEVGEALRGDAQGIADGQPDAALAKVEGENTGEGRGRSEEHTSELQSLRHLVCRLLLEK